MLQTPYIPYYEDGQTPIPSHEGSVLGDDKDSSKGHIRYPPERMSDAAHVYAYLVGTACFQTAFYISSAAKAFQNTVMGGGFLSIFIIYGHLFPVCG